MRGFFLGSAGTVGGGRSSLERDRAGRYRGFSDVKNRSWANLLWAAALSSIALFCVGCNSSEVGINTLPAGTTSGIAINVIPNPDSLESGGSGIQYAAVVTGDSTGDGVTWSITQGGVACTACGSLSNQTITSVTYTPPTGVSSEIQVQLIATSKANTAITGTATITSLPAGSGTVPFDATVANDSSGDGVTWSLSVNGAACTGCGTLSNVTKTTVTYTPPTSVSAEIQVELLATSIANPTLSSASTIIVSPASGSTPVITITVAPNPDSLQAGSAGVTFTATVTGSTAGVTWSLTEDGSGCDECGALTNSTATSVTYTPPPTVLASTAVQLIATLAGGTTTGSAAITVTPIPPVTITVAPNPESLQAGTAGVTFTATVTNSTAGVTWSVMCTADLCGTLSNATATTVTYTPPVSVPTATAVQLIATLVGGTTTGSAAITVTPATTSGPTVPRFLYSTNNLAYGRITIHSVNPSTSQLRFDGYALLNAAGDNVSEAVLSPVGNFLYAADVTAPGVYGFSIASNGQLTPLSSGAQVVPGAICRNLAIVTVASSANTFLYCFSGGNVTITPVNPDGTLGSYLSTSIGQTAATQIVFDPLGRFAYVGANTGIAAYSISPTTGALSQLNDGVLYHPGASGSSNVILGLTPNGSYLYAANPNDDHIYPYTIGSTGALTAVGTAPATGSVPAGVAIDPLSQFVFVSNEGASDISAYVINGDGSLTAEAGLASGSNPAQLIVDPSDKFLYVEDLVGSQMNDTGIQSFAIGANASLTPSLMVGEPPVGSLGILAGTAAVTYTPQFAYTANEGFSNISGFQVNASTGALTTVTGSPFSAGLGASQTIGIVADPFDRFVFAVNASDNPNTVSAFKITAGTGALAAVTGSPFPASGFGNMGIAEDASGSFVYAMSSGSNEISEFNVNQSSGALTTISGSPFTGTVGTAPEFSSPSAIVNSPFGSTLFVTNAGSGTIALLAIGANGSLSNFSGSPASSAESFTPDLVAAAVDPSNRFVYLLDSAGKDILAYDFSDSDSVSTSNFVAIGDGNAFALDPSGNNPTSLAIEPTGHYLYVTSSAGSSSGAVTVYSINQSNGVLTEVGDPVVVTIPSSAGGLGGGILTGAAVDPSGQYLYAVANDEASSGSSTVVFAFTINPANGTLTQQSTTFPAGYGANAMTVTGTAQ